MKRIAFFDFDGTITTKDTLLEFIKYHKGIFGFWLGFFLNSPYLLAYKLKLISNQTAKVKVLRYFFGRMNIAEFQQRCDDFSQNKVPHLIRPKAIKEIQMLQKMGAEVIVVSASPENWISTWANSVNAKLIATRFEIKNGRITGKISGKNCHGDEKVCRINELFTLPDYEEIYAYGDSAGDRPMLNLANISFYRPFR